MPQQTRAQAQHDTRKQGTDKQPAADTAQSEIVPKPESSSEYEGAPSRKPSDTAGNAVKTETSSSSGQ